MKNENVCTGCGATVTRDQHSFLRDSGGNIYCDKGGSEGLHSLALPPVAIKPEVALTPLEKEMLAALQDAQEGFFNLKPALREIGCFNGTPKDKECPCSLHKISRAIAKAEAVGA